MPTISGATIQASSFEATAVGSGFSSNPASGSGYSQYLLAGVGKAFMGQTAAGVLIAGAAAGEAFIRSNGIGIIFSADSGATINQRIAPSGAVTFSSTIATGAPTGGAGLWKLGIANVVTPTSPNRTITVNIGGTDYFIHAKTTNN